MGGHTCKQELARAYLKWLSGKSIHTRRLLGGIKGDWSLWAETTPWALKEGGHLQVFLCMPTCSGDSG